LPRFFRFIRFAKIATLVAAGFTTFYVILIIGWQITSLLRDGSWPALPLSSVMNMMEHGRDAIYVPASADEIERGPLANMLDALLRVPAIVPLLLALALLTAYYRWLTRIEKNYFGDWN
jgi:hypothetical protein